MKSVARSLVVVLVAMIAVPALVVTATITTAIQLLATTAFIMGGTEHPLAPPTDDSTFVTSYMAGAVSRFINPGAVLTAGTPQQTNGPVTTSVVAVEYPAEFFPVFGSTTFDDSVASGRQNLHSCLDLSPACNFNDNVSSLPNPDANDDFVVFGYSQSAVVASLVKRDLINNPTEGTARPTTFVLAANPMRPNGGILGRGFEGMTIPIIGITFYGATPTNSTLNNNGTPDDPSDDFYQYATVDVAQQYDLLGGDAPAVAWNVLAWANSAAAYYYLHGDVPSHSLNDAISQGSYGDTQYYMLTSQRLPILLPLQQAGVPDPLLAVADAPLRVLIESAYYRDTSPGQPVSFQLLPQKDLGTLTVNLVASVPVGIDDGLQQAGIGRLLGTNDVYRPFGVGGETYDKTTKEPAGVETGGNVFSDPVQTAGTQQAQNLKTASVPAPQSLTPPPTGDNTNVKTNNSNTTQLTNVPDQPETPAPVTRPRPLQIVRDSLNFDPTKKPSATRPSGDGPLKKIVGALTGQRPESATAGAADTKPAA